MALGLLGSILPSIIGGALSLKGGKDRNVAASAQSLRQMQFQERMSSTAHQREVKDLKAAGLNPILSGTGGAGSSSPGGAQASVQDVLTPAVNTALSARKLNQEIQNLKAQEELTRAQAKVIQPAALGGEVISRGAEGISDLWGARARPGVGIMWEDFKKSFLDLFKAGGTSARSRRHPPSDEAYSLPRLILRNLEIKR